MKHLTVEHVLRIHGRLVESSGGNPNLLDHRKLDAAVAQTRMTFDGQSLYPTLADKAAALGFSLNKAHAFADGNKRTAQAAMEMFLLRNGHEIDASVDDQEKVFLDVAAGAMNREVFTTWIKLHMVRRRS